MKLLALETSSDACSVALSVDNEVIFDHQIAPQKHAQMLLPMVEALLSKAGIKVQDLDGVAFGCGPGSFTGVRIAAATTQGIAFGADKGVIAVSSLQALAQGALREHRAKHVLAALDARMGEVYWGIYTADDNGIMQSQQADCVCAPADVSLPTDAVIASGTTDHQWLLVGSGAGEYESELLNAIGTSVTVKRADECWPNAQDVLTVALSIAVNEGFQPASKAIPVYLRDRVALTEKERASGERL